jgi:hypothetical protein
MPQLLKDCTVSYESALVGGITTVEATQNAIDATAGNVTYSAAALLRGIYIRNGGAANRSDVLPTAAAIVAALAAKYGQCVVGMMFDVLFVNETATANTFAIGLNTGVTSMLTNGTSFSAAIAQNASKRVTFRVTNAGVGTEAVQVVA